MVWLSFTQFGPAHHKAAIYRTESCATKLSLVDGPPFLTLNSSLLGEFCDTSRPLVCTRAALGLGGAGRPCRPGLESYVSRGRGLTLQQVSREPSAASSLAWAASYEFVTVERPGSCDREFRSDQAGGGTASHQQFAFSTPRDVFLFGRGGAQNISCVFRWVASRSSPH